MWAEFLVSETQLWGKSFNKFFKNPNESLLKLQEEPQPLEALIESKSPLLRLRSDTFIPKFSMLQIVLWHWSRRKRRPEKNFRHFAERDPDSSEDRGEEFLRSAALMERVGGWGVGDELVRTSGVADRAYGGIRDKHQPPHSPAKLLRESAGVCVGEDDAEQDDADWSWPSTTESEEFDESEAERMRTPGPVVASSSAGRLFCDQESGSADGGAKNMSSVSSSSPWTNSPPSSGITRSDVSPSSCIKIGDGAPSHEAVVSARRYVMGCDLPLGGAASFGRVDTVSALIQLGEDPSRSANKVRVIRFAEFQTGNLDIAA